jgi:hypothetical protein
MIKWSKPGRYARWLAVCAGAMDFSTGLGLVFWPGLTYAMMRVPVPSGEALVYGRFVGVFVGAVGLSYLLAWWQGSVGELRAQFRFTLPFRLAAGSFCAVAVAVGGLTPMWLSVVVTDYALVGGQIVLLRKNWEETG